MDLLKPATRQIAAIIPSREPIGNGRFPLRAGRFGEEAMNGNAQPALPLLCRQRRMKPVSAALLLELGVLVHGLEALPAALDLRL